MKIKYLVVVLMLCCGCKKYLDGKTDKSLVQPATLADAQALLDNYTQMNTFYPSIAAESEDDHFLLPASLLSLPTTLQDNYTWATGAFFSTSDVSWKFLYNNILAANMALETVGKNARTPQNAADYDYIRGQALFFRAFALFYAAEYFAAPYDSAAAATTPGIPLRLTSDVNEPVTRPSLKECYDRIYTDLQEACTLLPDTRDHLSRPNRAAAWALLARVALTMADYATALDAANKSLAGYNTLEDYNTVDSFAATPFKSLGPEVTFHAEALQNRAIFSPTAKTDTVLYASYDDNDLRKHLYFYASGGGYHSFKGSYAGSNYYDVPFIGLATDEQYLIAAECYARLGQTAKALEMLNTLLVNRWQAGKFHPFTAGNAEDALRLVLEHRRKELAGRGMRWLDLRRLNLDKRFAVTLTRVVNAAVITLPPGDPRYTFYIPDIVVKTSGLSQNQR
ncbi:MAG TPA: RagB/SusD family nutrient uptake outer membrane protein [Chitinophagaceae bacterium]|nr:RagB/SusD family nutrient uptake outer membrane protein [Chitinophagaceae bacterium]